jgi:hypothetical protein
MPAPLPTTRTPLTRTPRARTPDAPSGRRGRRTLAAYLPAAALALLSFLALSALSLRPPADSPQVAAVFPPGTDFPQVQARLAGTPMRLVRNGLTDWIAIVDLGGADPALLRGRGAWLILDPQALGGCLVRPYASGSRP